MILDWKNDKEFALANGVREGDYGETIYFCGKSKSPDEKLFDSWDAIHASGNFKDIIFKNFPNIHLNNSTFENCVFEDCGDICIDECAMLHCKFVHTDFVFGDKTDFYGCEFSDIESYVTLLSVDNECKIDGCVFENIHIKGFDTHICIMNGDKEKNIRYLTNCQFINCILEDSNCPLSTYVYNTFLLKGCEKENLDDSCKIINK